MKEDNRCKVKKEREVSLLGTCKLEKNNLEKKKYKIWIRFLMKRERPKKKKKKL
jgi:hypothetical protein